MGEAVQNATNSSDHQPLRTLAYFQLGKDPATTTKTAAAAAAAANNMAQTEAKPQGGKDKTRKTRKKHVGSILREALSCSRFFSLFFSYVFTPRREKE